MTLQECLTEISQLREDEERAYRRHWDRYNKLNLIKQNLLNGKTKPEDWVNIKAEFDSILSSIARTRYAKA